MGGGGPVGLWAAPIRSAFHSMASWPPAHGASRGFGVRSPASPFPVGSMAADVRGGCQVGVIVATNRSDLKEVWMAHGRGRQPGAAGFVRPWGGDRKVDSSCIGDKDVLSGFGSEPRSCSAMIRLEMETMK